MWFWKCKSVTCPLPAISRQMHFSAMCVTPQHSLHVGVVLEILDSNHQTRSFAVCPSLCTPPYTQLFPSRPWQVCRLSSLFNSHLSVMGKPNSLYFPNICRTYTFLSISVTTGYETTLGHHHPNCLHNVFVWNPSLPRCLKIWLDWYLL